MTGCSGQEVQHMRNQTDVIQAIAGVFPPSKTSPQKQSNTKPLEIQISPPNQTDTVALSPTCSVIDAKLNKLNKLASASSRLSIGSRLSMQAHPLSRLSSSIASAARDSTGWSSGRGSMYSVNECKDEEDEEDESAEEEELTEEERTKRAEEQAEEQQIMNAIEASYAALEDMDPSTLK